MIWVINCVMIKGGEKPNLINHFLLYCHRKRVLLSTRGTPAEKAVGKGEVKGPLFSSTGLTLAGYQKTKPDVCTCPQTGRRGSGRQSALFVSAVRPKIQKRAAEN